MGDDIRPPSMSVGLEHASARAPESSDGDEHFSDASEGHKPPSSADGSQPTSPIPITRVERVDDQPLHGEVPGTAAYKQRTQDAVPDEVEIVPEGTRSRSLSRARSDSRPMTPGGSPVPRTVVEKVDPSIPSHGDVPGTAAYELRKADAEPDVVLTASETPKLVESKHPRFPIPNTGPASVRLTEQGSPTASTNRSPTDEFQLAPTGEAIEGEEEAPFADEIARVDDPEQPSAREADGADEDMDDFEEGVDEDDFGDFDDGFQQAEDEEDEHASEKSFVEPPLPTPQQSSIPALDFSELDTFDEIVRASQSHVQKLFPDAFSSHHSSDQWPDAKSIFLSERSRSLWAQLAAPPPLQPPNWVRSRIRRLFLVSLGVPIDLDEILPASKQKKLVLPSISISSDKSPPASSDEKANGAVSRVKQANQSTASVDSTSSRTERRRRGRSPAPELNINSTVILCSTTDAALRNFTDDELKAHFERLEDLRSRASTVLEYWLKRKDSALGDKDAFEGVIENLVKHAKKVRK